MSNIYGPVPSWRLGRSLGVDVTAPPKKCTFNCVYCQLGKTKIHVSTPEMLEKPLVGPDKVLADLDDVLKRIDLETVDIVTFSGTGEPTLNLSLGEIAEQVKARIGMLPMAILTNSSLFYREDIRRNLSKFDLVVAKLDAGDDTALKLINRPADRDLRISTLIDSIKKLRGEIKATLALQVMLLHSENGRVTNVKGEHLKKLINAIIEVQPDIVQLEVPYRPPSESYVRQPPRRDLREISQKLSEALGRGRLWIYGIHDRRRGNVMWLRHRSLEKEVLDLLGRRPCRITDIAFSLGIEISEARRILRMLEKKAEVKTRMVNNKEFYFKGG
ncbi:MAG: Fe-S oxidoreductase [Candidatus Bathyarchaeota archaeon B63]|nr:MAG: Fe-S oxidoreductase [Candidatus Bathyarchaeota archaeon B63]